MIFSDSRWGEAAMPGTRGVFGRGRELGAVATFLEGLPSGPSGLLLEGEAGIGKTTVWAAGVADAAACSYLILSSRPAESEATLSFAALGDLVDGILERVLAELPLPQQNALQVALLLKDPAGRPLEHGAVCAAFLPGEVGEIMIAGHNIMKGYWGQAGGDGRGDHRRLVPYR
jgi:acyl-CoA synthetase (AMP-forming)/AMP-acid ligase II